MPVEVLGLVGACVHSNIEHKKTPPGVLIYNLIFFGHLVEFVQLLLERGLALLSTLFVFWVELVL